MELKRLVVGLLETNCYIAEADNIACVIDPGEDCDKILAEIADCKLDKIILTHGHFDHFMAADELRKKTGAEIYISQKDACMLEDFKGSLYEILGRGETGFIKTSADAYLDDKVIICGEEFEVIETPGHSEGSVCLLRNKLLFSGDTLFQRSIGRYDHGDYNEIMHSLWKLMLLDDDVNVLPGHGDITTIGQERRENPFLR